MMAARSRSLWEIYIKGCPHFFQSIYIKTTESLLFPSAPASCEMPKTFSRSHPERERFMASAVKTGKMQRSSGTGVKGRHLQDRQPGIV